MSDGKSDDVEETLSDLPSLSEDRCDDIELKKFRSLTDTRIVMESVGSVSLSSFVTAATLQNPVGIAMLKTALDTNAAAMTQLLEGLSSPQKANAGTIVDVKA